MLLAAGKRRQVCWLRTFRAPPGAPPRNTELTDPAARPAANENHLLISAYTTHPQSPLLSVSRRISDSGCNLVDARLTTVGRDVSVTALAVGSWDAVAKLEAMGRPVDHALCYQSRVGPMKWLGPSTPDAIAQAGRDGVGVIVAPVAFVSEHIETLVELDIEYAELAHELGVTPYLRSPAVGVAAPAPVFARG